jgi:4-amino-4-deoxy-L-arabinose transferase-like glycosyltransferase
MADRGGDAVTEGSGDQRRVERLALAGILGLAALLRLWRLAVPGHGNTYYAAGVRSMMLSSRNFLFGAFDPAGFVSVDKPPVAFWVQTVSAWLFGYNGLSLRLPQALGGVLAVALVYHLVRRAWGAGAGLLAALTLAITPIAVAADRVNSTDALLVLVLVIAAWPLCRSAETGRLGPLALSMALVGVAFNVKMLAAYVVLPAFVLVYVLTAPGGWRTRMGRAAAAAVVLVVVSLSWSVVVDLTPPSKRPYVGDSQNNTEMDLIFGYNGVARLMAGTRWALGNWRGAPAGAPRVTPPDAGTPPVASAGAAPAPDDQAAGPGAGGTGALPPGFVQGRGGRARFGGGPPGPLRLADEALAGDVTWLFPLAGFGLLAALIAPGRRSLREPRGQAVLFWGLWLVCGAIVFSFAEGMFRPYYVVLLAPAAAALVGIGVTALWHCYRERGWASALLPAALLVTAAWQGYVLREYRLWGPALTAIAVGGGVIAGLSLIWVRFATAESAVSRGPRIALTVGLVALLAAPAAWAATPALVGRAASVPTVGPDLLAGGARGRGGFGPGAEAPDTSRLVDFLREHRHGERYFLATVNAMQAAPIIVRTGEPVMAIGGWSGGDPILTVDQFAALVADGQVRYVLVPDGPRRDGGGGAGGPAFFGRGAGRDGRNGALFRWVTEHGRPVDPALWQPERSTAESDASGAGPAGGGRPGGGRAGSPGFAGRPGWRGGFGRAQQLYDCRPEAVDTSVGPTAS